jgi:hypothetical protein
MLKPEITSYSVVDLLSWQESGALKISPKFQRRSVWSSSAKGHFIDSILQEYPIPPIHIRLAGEQGNRTVREVIDGQQRIRSVFDFISGAYRIPRAVSTAWGGKGYDQLSDENRDELNLFSFTVYQYKKLGDAEVLDMFSRLNTYSVSLSSQELRNGKWFGQFKQVSYRLSTEALEFWRRHRIFTEQQIARMREAELVSELLAAQLDGLQDKKNPIDAFYENLDEEWGTTPVVWEFGSRDNRRTQPSEYRSARTSVTRFRETMGAIDESMGDLLQESPLRRPALFYTLYCSVYHILFGLPRADDVALAGEGMTDEIKGALRRVAGQITDLFENRGRTREGSLLLFYEGAARQTDNIGPRQERMKSLLHLVDEAR